MGFRALVLFATVPLLGGSRLPSPAVWFESIPGGRDEVYRTRLPGCETLVSGINLSFHFGASSTIDLTYVAANPSAVPAGAHVAGRVNYLFGLDPHSWRTDVPAYASLRVPALYRGIELVYRGVVSGMESDFLVAPDADPEQIRMRFSGARQVTINNDGTLVVSGLRGEVRQSKPVAYQDMEGGRREVDADFVWRDGSIGIRTGPYDHRLALVIDPMVVAYVGVFGGSTGDEGDAIAVDRSGIAYIAGYTSSYNFPITPGAPNNGPNISGSSFVTKLNPGLNGIVYSTYLGGKARGIAVDNAGEAYVIATGGNDIEVTKLTADGNAILYQASLPGPGQGLGIAVDGSGNAYVTGSTSAANFPVSVGAFQTSLHGASDAFVAKLDAAGKIVYASYLGGSGDEEGRSITVDTAGNAYVAGVTHNSTDFPVVNAAQPTAGGAFVYRSDDGGATWTPAGNGISESVPVLAVSPADGSVVYGALGEGGLVKTTDGGANWTAAGTGLGSQQISSLAIDANLATLYAADGNTVYRSLDGGMNWQDVGAGTVLPQGVLGSLLVASDPAHSGVVYAGRAWLAKSTDSGNTWQLVNYPSMYSPYQLQVDGSSSAIYVSGYYVGVQKSVDGGLTWKSIAPYSSYFALTPTGTVYTTMGSSIVRSNDGGSTWNVVGPAPSGIGFDMPMAANPTRDGVVYTWTGNSYSAGGSYNGAELYEVTSGANSWQWISQMLSGESAPVSGPLNSVSAFAAAAATPSRLYYAASAGWDGFAAKIDPTGSKLLYATYLGGISNDYANAIAVDANGNAYIAGATASGNFPVSEGSIQAAFTGTTWTFRDPRDASDIGIVDYPRGTNAFVAKLDASGSQLLYASYLGSTGVDWGLGVTVDALGEALVAGYTTCFGFPAVADHFVPPASARFSAFLSQLAPNGSQLSYSTCFGGTGGVAATGVALGANGVLLTGLGGSNMVLSPDSGTVGTVLFSELELSNRCDVNQDGREDLLDVQSVTNEALGVTTAVHDLNGDGAVTVVDVQMVIGAVLGVPCQ